MRPLSLVFAGLLAASAAWSQTQTIASAEVGQVVDIQLGVMAPDERRDLAFTIWNHTDRAFQSGNISTTCGCTRTSADVIAIPAGGSEEFHVTFHAPAEPTVRISQVWFQSVDPDEPRWGIRLTAEVRTDLSVDPAEVNIGAISIASSGEQTRELRVSNNTDSEVTILGLEATPEAFRAVASPEFIAPHGTSTLVVTFTPPRETGQVMGQLTLRTSAENRPETHIPMRAQMTGRVEVEPDRAWFGFVPIGETRSVTLTLRGAEQAFAITGMDIDAPGLTAEAATAEGGIGHIVVHLDTEAAGAGIIDRTMIVHTNDPIEPLVRVNVLGMVSQ